MKIEIEVCRNCGRTKAQDQEKPGFCHNWMYKAYKVATREMLQKAMDEQKPHDWITVEDSITRQDAYQISENLSPIEAELAGVTRVN